MNDLISRRAAIEALYNHYEVNNKAQNATMDECIMLVKNIPSAEPKRGRWVFTRYYVWECSECGENPTKGMGYIQRRSELFRYCPHCGATMVVDDE